MIRLKKIEPNTVIQCVTMEEAATLLGILEGMGYAWNTGEKLTEDFNYLLFRQDTGYIVDCNSKRVTFTCVCDETPDVHNAASRVVKFRDIIYEESITAEEVLQAIHEICKIGTKNGTEVCAEDCPLRRLGCKPFHFGISYNAAKIVEVCEQWKFAKETQQEGTEKQWLFAICADGKWTGTAATEEEAIRKCESVVNCGIAEEAVYYKTFCAKQ